MFSSIVFNKKGDIITRFVVGSCGGGGNNINSLKTKSAFGFSNN